MEVPCPSLSLCISADFVRYRVRTYGITAFIVCFVTSLEKNAPLCKCDALGFAIYSPNCYEDCYASRKYRLYRSDSSVFDFIARSGDLHVRCLCRALVSAKGWYNKSTELYI